MRIRILCTLGPSSLDPDVIRSLTDHGADLFRINLCHTPLHSLEATIHLVTQHSDVPICLDTQGAQVRCGTVVGEVELERGKTVFLTPRMVEGHASLLTIWPAAVFGELRVGSRLQVDFDSVALEVLEVTGEGAKAVVTEPGRIRSNKAVTVHPPIALPCLTEVDRQAIEIGIRRGIRHFALSFASSKDDVELLRRLTPPGSEVMAKIETRAGVRNMDGIIAACDALVVDRGDLSREIPIEYVPFYQKVIVRRANRWNRRVYVATNLLESMVGNRNPTVAEANDIANTLLDGVHGLVLAAETAIGIDPVGTVSMVARAIEAFHRSDSSSLFDEDRGPSAQPPRSSTFA